MRQARFEISSKAGLWPAFVSKGENELSEQERLVELDAIRARDQQKAAEIQRDVMANVAVGEAANRQVAESKAIDASDQQKTAEIQRDVMANVAVDEAANRQVAESRAVDARMDANQSAAAAQEMATERNLLHNDLAAERHVSANNAFGFYLMTALLVGVMVVIGIFYYFQRQDAVNAASRNSTVTVNSPTPVTVQGGSSRR